MSTRGEEVVAHEVGGVGQSCAKMSQLLTISGICQVVLVSCTGTNRLQPFHQLLWI